MRQFLRGCILLVGVALAGCQTDGAGDVSASATSDASASASASGDEIQALSPTLTVAEPADVKYYPSDEPLKLALEYFNRGAYGLAAQYFENAVTKAPKDATGWIGLAASYDRIGRFDLADRAYKQAKGLVGETTTILNNEGYSYMLRGKLVAARRKLLKAYERDPRNPVIANNLQLLDSSWRFIRRDPDAGL